MQFLSPILFDYTRGRYENNMIHNIDNSKNMEIHIYKRI